MSRSLKALGSLFTICAILIFVMGAWTYSFEVTEGKLEKVNIGRDRLSGDYSGIPFGGNIKGSVQRYSIEYSYHVDGVSYKSNRIGMGISHLTLSPMKRMYWEKLAAVGSNVDVYYSTMYPHISVIIQGIDWVVVFLVSVIGTAAIYFSAWIKRHA